MSTFSHVKHLLSVILQIQNREVKDFFSDVSVSDADIENWFQSGERERVTLPSPGRSSLRMACLIRKEDSWPIVLVRMFLFYVVLGVGTKQNLNKENLAIVYGVPAERHHSLIRFKPQIKLYFVQKWEEREDGYSPIDAEISFRVTEFENENITQQDIESLAKKIRKIFLPSGKPFSWQKGKSKTVYREPEKGYHLTLFPSNQDEGEMVVHRVLSLRGHSLDPAKLSKTEKEKFSIEKTKTILGQKVKAPRVRPAGKVYFRSAELYIWGLLEPLMLVDAKKEVSGD